MVRIKLLFAAAKTNPRSTEPADGVKKLILDNVEMYKL